MAEKKPSKRSPTKSSAGPSKVGSPRGPAPAPAPARRAGGILDETKLLSALEAGRFPASLYVEGPDEALKAALLSEIRFAWARSCSEAPHARVLRAAESG